MGTKTFKIGEYCLGGVITVVISKDSITLIGKEWDFTDGSNKSSDQSKAKEFTRLEVSLLDGEAGYKLLDKLNDLTTSYYADEVMKYIKSNSTLKSVNVW